MRVSITLLILIICCSSSLIAQDFYLKIDAHQEAVNTVCFTPDGKYLASCSDDKYLYIWDLQNGTKMHEYISKEPIKDLDINNDGNLLCFVEGSSVVGINIYTWEKIFEEGNAWMFNSVSFSPDGSYIVAGDSYGGVKLININNQDAIKDKAHKSTISDIGFDQSGKYLYTISAEDEISVWDINENNKLKLKNTFHGSSILFFNDKAICGDKSMINVYNLSSKERISEISNESGNITNLLMNGEQLVSSSDMGTLKLFSLAGESLNTFVVSANSITDIAYHKESNMFSCALSNGNIIIYKRLEKFFRNITVTADYYIIKYVEDQINDWQKKGRYEKTENYEKRVNGETRNIQIEVYTQEAINNYVLEEIKWDEIEADYDADNESFKLEIKGLPPIIIQVPISEARSFDENFKELKYANPKCVFTLDNTPAISYLEIYNPANEKVYIYDSKDNANFKTAHYEFNFDEIEVELPQAKDYIEPVEQVANISLGKSDVDIDIPINTLENKNVYALVIGNEDYSSYQADLGSEVNVKYASNDARVFKSYLVNTLGVPDNNIYLLLNATYGQSMQYISKLEAITEILGEEAEIIFYYSGHGFPDEITKEPYIMPVDASATNLISAIKLNQLYDKLTRFKSRRVTIFLDACFSGGAREQGLLAARSVKIKPQENQITGNVVVFTASSDVESAMAYDEKQHGMFTYYLLKKLQDSKGNVTYKELGDYIRDQVQLQSVIINNKKQVPEINLGRGIDEGWGNWQFVK